MRGNTGAAPLKVLDEEGLISGGQRWRFVPLKKRLQGTSARPAALPLKDYTNEFTTADPENTSFSHFADTLSTERDNNITATFNAFSLRVRSLATSLPLLYRNRKKIFDLAIEALLRSSEHGSEATVSICRCITALSKDLGPDEFYPFFAPLVQTIANIFAPPQRDEGARDAPSRKESILWDPETSLVPLFSLLATVSKSHLQKLTEDPDQTVNDLMPLFCVPIARVREMTAESCAGYLLRKTRDANTAKVLTRSLVLAHTQPPDLQSRCDVLIEGVGTSLYEAIRQPGGRIHNRAHDVLKNAIQALRHLDSEQSGNLMTDGSPDDRRYHALQVVSECCKKVVFHVRSKEDLWKLTSVLLQEGETARKQNRAWIVGSVLYLFKNWIRTGGKRLSSCIGIANVQKILNFFTRCLDSFNEDGRIAYEGFGATLFLCLELGSQQQRVAVRSINLALSAIDQSSSQVVSSRALYSFLNILRTNSERFSKAVLRSAIPKIGRICERSFGANTELKQDVCLRLSMLLLSLLRSACGSDYSFRKFKVPALEKNIKEVLDEAVTAENGMQCNCNLVSVVLNILCYMRVEAADEVLCKLLKRVADLDFFEISELLEAATFQLVQGSKENAEQTLSETELQEQIKLAAGVILFERQSWNVSELRSLSRYGKAFPAEVIELLGNEDVSRSNVLNRLTENISCSGLAVRLGSAELLAILGDKQQVPPGDTKPRESVNELVATIRTELSEEPPLFHGLYGSAVRLLAVSFSLEGIAENQRLINEIIRITDATQLDKKVLKVLAHLSIGMLRTPLRAIWENAGNLWQAAAKQDTGLLMDVASHFIEECVGVFSPDGKDNDFAGEDGALATISDPMNMEGQDGKDGKGGKEMNIEERTSKGSKRQGGDVLTEPHEFSSSSEKGTPHRDSLIWNPKEHSLGLNLFPESTLELGSHSGNVRDGSDGGELFGFMPSLIKLLDVLAKEPRHLLKYRPQLVEAYLSVAPKAVVVKRGHEVSSALIKVLESSGGLKCSENDKSREQRMRVQLLSDVTRPCPPLQKNAVRCLCASRSPILKPHRDSLIRLIDDGSFREELTILTESLTNGQGQHNEDGSFGDSDDPLVDLLTRICFSKMTGKQGHARQGGVLTFVMSRLPASTVIRKLTTLALSPLNIDWDKCSSNNLTASDSTVVVTGPVQRGMLNSIESLLKHCRRSIPEDAWNMIAIGTVTLLRNSSVGTSAQNIRSRSLRLLAEMYCIRPEETEFVISLSFTVLREHSFQVGGHDKHGGVSALLRLTESVFSSGSRLFILRIAKDHGWAVQHCIQTMGNTYSEKETVVLGLSITKRFAQVISSDVVVDAEELQSLAAFGAESLGLLLERMTELIVNGKAFQKTWVPVFNDALELLSLFASLPFPCSRLMIPLGDGLCSLLHEGPTHLGFTENALIALASIIKKMNEPSDGKENSEGVDKRDRWVIGLAPMLLTWELKTNHKAYEAFCDLLCAVGIADLSEVAKMLRDLDAMERSRLDSPDLDKRIESLNLMIGMAKDGIERSKTSAAGALLVKKEGMEDMECGLISYTYMFHGCISSIRTEDIALRGTAGYGLSLFSTWAGLTMGKEWKEISWETFNALMGCTTKAKNVGSRREYSRALGEFLRHNKQRQSEWDESFLSKCMEPLVNEKDLESDFFENVVHLQPHRRSRAIRQLQKHLSNWRAGDSSEEDKLRWSHFSSSFALPLAMNMALERRERKRPRTDRNTEARESAENDVHLWAIELVGASTSVLSWVEFRNTFSGILKKIRYEEEDEVLQMLEKLLVCCSTTFTKCWKEVEDADMRRLVVAYIKKILPKMLQFVSAGAVEGKIIDTGKSAENGTRRRNRKNATTFRGNVACAVGSIMRCLPEEELENGVAVLIAPISGALRSRMFGTRSQGNKALKGVILCWGEKYVRYILKQVLESLSEGFRRDTCVHVIHVVLMGIAEVRREGKMFEIDQAVDVMLEYLCRELKEGVAESKRDYRDPNLTETRERGAAMRARKVGECAELLAELVVYEENMVRIGDEFGRLSVRKRVDMVLQRVVVGLGRNGNVGSKGILRYCYTLGGKVWGLQLLNSVLAREMKRLDEDMELRSMCEGFLGMVTEGLASEVNEVRLYSLRAAQKLMKVGLRNEAMTDKVSETVIEMLSNGHAEREELLITCLRSGGILLDGEVQKERVEALVRICMDWIEQGSVDIRSASMNLLRKIVARRIMVSGVYDAMERVNKLAIHSQSGSVRKACISVSIDFMMNLPLESKRIRQHMEFFVRNVGYKTATGRQAALQAIKLMIQRMELDGDAEYLLLATVSCSNDTDGHCRKLALECVQELYKRGDGAMLLGLAKRLCKSDDDSVRYAGVNALTAGVRQGYTNGVSEIVRGLWGRCQDWQAVYGLVRCVESLGETEDMGWIVAELPELLTHRQVMIRECAGRLLGKYVQGIWKDAVLTRRVVKAVCVQLEADDLTEDMAEGVLRNLVLLAETVRLGEVGDVGDGVGVGVGVGEGEGEKEKGRCWKWMMGRVCGMGMRGGPGVLRRVYAVKFLTEAGGWYAEDERYAQSVARVTVKMVDGHVDARLTEVAMALDQHLKSLLPNSWLHLCHHARQVRDSKRRRL